MKFLSITLLFFVLVTIVSSINPQKLFVKLVQYNLDPSACTSGYSGLNGDGTTGNTGYITGNTGTGTGTGTGAGSSGYIESGKTSATGSSTPNNYIINKNENSKIGSSGRGSGNGSSTGNSEISGTGNSESSGTGSNNDGLYYCSEDRYVGQTFYPVNTCIYFGGWYILFTVEKNNYVNASSYSDENCEYWETSDFNPGIIKPNECINICDYNPFKLSVVNASQIIIPNNTLSTIQYSGVNNCKTSLENSIAVSFLNLNTCLMDFKSRNYYLTCNSTVLNYHLSYAHDCSTYNGLKSYQISRTCEQTWAQGVIQSFCNI